MGKTALALNIVQHAAIEHNTGVAFFSIEMSKDALVQRLLCSEGLVDAQRLRRGQLRDDDYPKLARAAGLLGTAPIWIDDSPSLTPLAMRSKARRLKAEHDIALVIVDYLQLMQGPGDVENRQQEISYISRSLKALAKELRARRRDLRSEEHTSELQSPCNLVCRLLLEKKNKQLHNSNLIQH